MLAFTEESYETILDWIRAWLFFMRLALCARFSLACLAAVLELTPLLYYISTVDVVLPEFGMGSMPSCFLTLLLSAG